MNDIYHITFDLPIPYKGLNIYPIKVKDYLFFNTYAQCLTFDKNSIPDEKIISMTNLEYIYFAAEKNMEQTPYIIWFDRLLSLCLQEEDSFKNLETSIMRYNFDEKGQAYFKIGDKKYNSDDYEQLKIIIAEQNLVELPDENMAKEVRDSLEKAREYKSKISGKTGTFEDYIIAVSTVTGWAFEYIYSMPIRKFMKSLTRLDNYIHYKIYLTSSLSGMVEYKDKSFIKHWLTNLDSENRYEDVSLDLDEIQNKVSLESAK